LPRSPGARRAVTDMPAARPGRGNPEPADPPAYYETVICILCGGSGKRGIRICPLCKGKRRIKVIK
jgi:DnaJ-class molecular chaperone